MSPQSYKTTLKGIQTLATFVPLLAISLSDVDLFSKMIKIKTQSNLQSSITSLKGDSTLNRSYLCNAAAWLCSGRVAATTKKMAAALKTLALGEIRRTIIRMENYSFVASRGLSDDEVTFWKGR